MSLEKAYSEIKAAIRNRLEFESFNVVKSVNEHRNFWKPDKVRTLLLAESHVFTTNLEHDSTMQYDGFTELKECPTGYVKLVYCLGYGEKDMVKISVNRGTPQFYTAPPSYRPHPGESLVATPKRRTSQSRTRTRRNHNAIKPRTLHACHRCSQPVPPHVICSHCGFYKGKARIKIDDEIE